MSDTETELELQPRTAAGSPAARAVRRAGKIPGVLYGRGREPVAFQVDAPALRTVLTGEGGRHAIIALAIDGRSAHAMLKDYQLDPVRDRLTHVDLIEISMDESLVATVVVHLEGEPEGVRNEDGVLEQSTHEIEVQTLPRNLPSEIVVDVSALGVGDSIRLGDVTPPEGVTWVSDAETVLAAVIHSTTMEDIEAEQAAEAEGQVAEDVDEETAEDEEAE